MKRIILTSAVFLLVLFVNKTNAAISPVRKTSTQCGQGQKALDCFVSHVKNGTLGKNLNCSESSFWALITKNVQTQSGVTETNWADKLPKAPINQLFAKQWPKSDLINSGCSNGKLVSDLALTGGADDYIEVAVLVVNGVEIPFLKLEGSGGNACWNPVLSKTVRPSKKITETPPPSNYQNNQTEYAELPNFQPRQNQVQQVVVYQQQDVLLSFPQNTAFTMPVVAFAHIAVVQPSVVIIGNNNCQNCGQHNNPPKDSVGHTWNGDPIVGDPYVDPRTNPNGGPVVGNPGDNYWGNNGNSGNGGPNEGNPGGNYWGNNGTTNNGITFVNGTPQE